jgi:hypothetical protein
MRRLPSKEKAGRVRERVSADFCSADVPGMQATSQPTVCGWPENDIVGTENTETVRGTPQKSKKC